MIINKKNKVVGFSNLILGVLMCIVWFLFPEVIRTETTAYLNLSTEQSNILVICSIIMIIPFIITFIINFIYIFKNRHSKKDIIINILTIIIMGTSIALTFIFESYKYFYINISIALLGIILLFISRKEEEDKKHRFLFILTIIQILLFIGVSIAFILVRNDFEIWFANNEKNLITNIIQNSNNSNNSNIPIRVMKNNKWGYINSNGNVIADFIYDDCADFIEITFTDTNDKYYIAPVLVNDTIKLITIDNKEIASFRNKKKERIGKISYIIIYNLKENLEIYAKKVNKNIKISYDKNYSYDYEKENGFESNLSFEEDVLSFDVENEQGKKFELLYNTKTQSVTYNKRKVSIDGQLIIYEDKEDYDFKYIDSYKNGYIPIYNFEKEIFGWIDTNGKVNYLNGKIQILDFTNNFIAVKDYSLQNSDNIYLVDYKGNKVSENFKEIKVLKNGFVVKKQNDKNVYLDENLEVKTKEYDIIDTCNVEKGFLIASDINSYSIENLKFDLISISTYKTIYKNLEYISGMNDYKYNAMSYEDNLTAREFKKNLCSVDCNYINTDIYMQKYK